MQRMDLEHLAISGWLSPLDYHFGAFITRFSGEDDPELFLAAALVSKYTGQGHVCFDLSSVAGKPLLEEESGGPGLSCLGLDAWRDRIERSLAVGRPGEMRPLILDEKHRLYLYRYWEYESNLAGFIRERSSARPEDVDRSLLLDGLARHFPPPPARDGKIDWQEVAAFTAVVNRLCVISGGPGTGKTTTVAKILALLLEQAGGGRLRIGLAAPTGKAATRLEEAIGEAKTRLNCADTVKAAIPEDASTIHRLLGPISGSPYFRHNCENPLATDVVVVDEASMVDLALMAKLVSALPPRARLILLGDKDQLSSVEAGAVLGDICDAGQNHPYIGRAQELSAGMDWAGDSMNSACGNEPPIADCIVELRRSYRFGEDSGIGALSRLIKEGDGDGAVDIVRKGGFQDIGWKEMPHPEALERALRSSVLSGCQEFLKSSTLSEMFESFQRFRILCALRKGPFGAAALNSLVEHLLLEDGLIRPGQWYHGRPIMVTRNDYNLRLFNGDIGFILRDGWQGSGPVRDSDPLAESPSAQQVRAVFPVSNAPPRAFPPARLPEHETVYATTVHKSQGSEFDEVLLILSDRESPALTRELLYTGITRARKKLVIWGIEPVFRSAVSRRIRRSSGLRDAIWTPPSR